MELKYYNLIHDREQVRKFFGLLCVDKVENTSEYTEKEKFENADEVNFIAAVARNKYLREEQKKDFHIHNSTSMLQRIVCRDTSSFDSYFAHLLRLNVPHGSYSNEGKDIPENVC